MELQEILDTTRRIATTITADEVEVIEQEYVWPEKTMRALQDAGLGGLVVPKSEGGLGKGMMAVAKVCEELGKVSASAGLCFGMHCVGTAVIAAKATAFQKEHFLRPIAEGKHFTTLAVSEPGTGAHFYFPQTQLKVLDAAHYEVHGKKTFVTNASHADSYVVSTMAADPTAPPDHFSAVVVLKDMEGMTWGPPWRGLGMRGNASTSMDLHKVRIKKDHLLGKEGDQLWYVFNVIAPYFLIAMAGTYLGLSEAALRQGIDHIKKRSYSHSGTSLASNPILQFQVGKLWSKVERTRSLIYNAASLGDFGEPSAMPAILACKAEVGECVTEVVNEAMTLVGGIGYRENSALDRMLRDARAAHVMAPTTNLLYTWIGRTMLDQPILME